MEKSINRITRRQALAATTIGGLGGATAFSARANVLSSNTEKSAADSSSAAGISNANVCMVTPDVTQGPYYEPDVIERRDITDGKKGVPLELRVIIVDDSCRPIANARVDVWHSDAQGIYSGQLAQGDDHSVSTADDNFLRGTQYTDDHGAVVFNTIYPGWYAARTPHIHFKVFIDDKTRLTAQMYFPDALSEYIYLNAPDYQRELERDTVNLTDWILVRSTRNSMAFVQEQVDRYVASITYGVNPAAERVPEPAPPSRPNGAPIIIEQNTPPENRVSAMIPSAENALVAPAEEPTHPSPRSSGD
ncbi:MAG: hypothetical protein R3C40_05720 [Parvularculaceae bacterium]